jgi:hypothetical protein
LEPKRGNGTVLAYVSEWEDAASAGEYFNPYRRVLDGKWKAMKIAREQSGSIAGTGDDGHFLLRLEGTRVSSLEGFPSELH